MLRGGEVEKLRITLGIQPKVVPDEEETDFGFSVQEVTERLYLLHRLDDRNGVLVSFVERGSEAAEAGMKVGDLIVAIEQGEVSNIEDFRAAMETVDTTRRFLVRARRGPRDTRFLLIVPRATPPPRAQNAPAKPGQG